MPRVIAFERRIQAKSAAEGSSFKDAERPDASGDALTYIPETVDKIEQLVANGERCDVTRLSSAEFKALLLKSKK